jgi:hypothetical protein
MTHPAFSIPIGQLLQIEEDYLTIRMIVEVSIDSHPPDLRSDSTQVFDVLRVIVLGTGISNA